MAICEKKIIIWLIVAILLWLFVYSAKLDFRKKQCNSIFYWPIVTLFMASICVVVSQLQIKQFSVTSEEAFWNYSKKYDRPSQRGTIYVFQVLAKFINR